MTPSTTNTAAQAGKSLYDEYSGNHPTIHSNRFPSWSELTQAQRDEWNRKAPESTIPPQAATLTQQQGGEQEVAWQNIETAEAEFLTNLADKGGLADPVPGMLRHCARLIAGKRPAVIAPDRYETEEEGDAYAHGYVDGEDAALRTKQPAASEGDGRAAFEKWIADQFGYSTEKMVWDGKQYQFGPTGFLWEAWEASAAALRNTSKQAAGEAVACGHGDAFDASDCALCNPTPPRHPADEALIAAYDAGFAASDEGWNAEIWPDVESRPDYYVKDRAEAIAALQAGTP